MNLRQDFLNTLSVKLVVLFFGLISSILSARILGPAGFGAGVMLLILPPIIIKFANIGVASSVIYFANRYPEEKEGYFGTALTFAAFLSFVVTAVLLGLLPFILSSFYKHTVPRSLLFLVFLFSCVYVFEFFFNCIIRALGMIKQYNYLTELVPTVLTFFLTIVLIGFLKMGLSGYVYISLATNSVVTFLMLLLLLRERSIFFRLDLTKLRMMINYGLRGYFVNVSAALQERIDKLNVAFFLTPEQVGIYQIAHNLWNKLMIFPRALGTPLLPKMSTLSRQQAADLVRKLLNDFLSLLFLIVLSIVLSPFLIKTLYGNHFLPAFYPFAFMALAVLFMTFNKVMGMFFVGSGRPELKSGQRILSLLIRTALLFYFVPRTGIVGCGIAILVSEFVVFLPSYVFYRRTENVSERIFSLDLKRRILVFWTLTNELNAKFIKAFPPIRAIFKRP